MDAERNPYEILAKHSPSTFWRSVMGGLGKHVAPIVHDDSITDSLVEAIESHDGTRVSVLLDRAEEMGLDSKWANHVRQAIKMVPPEHPKPAPAVSTGKKVETRHEQLQNAGFQRTKNPAATASGKRLKPGEATGEKMPTDTRKFSRRKRPTPWPSRRARLRPRNLNFKRPSRSKSRSELKISRVMEIDL